MANQPAPAASPVAPPNRLWLLPVDDRQRVEFGGPVPPAEGGRSTARWQKAQAGALLGALGAVIAFAPTQSATELPGQVAAAARIAPIAPSPPAPPPTTVQAAPAPAAPSSQDKPKDSSSGKESDGGKKDDASKSDSGSTDSKKSDSGSDAQVKKAVELMPDGLMPGADQMARWINTALKILRDNGVDTSKINADDIRMIINHESGGNPNAVNNWDSNAAKGTPSKGLMQVIAPTFQSFALPGHKDIMNPVDNIIAGVQYSLSRYGSLDGVPGISALKAGGSYMGY